MTQNATQQDVFGASNQAIEEILRAALGRQVTLTGVSVDHRIEGHPGYQGDKCIPTCHYIDATGAKGQFVVFVKRHATPGHSEAVHYLHLPVAAPLPRYYGHVLDPEQREILFLAYLDKVYTTSLYADPSLFDEFIRLIADVNTLLVSEAHFGQMRTADLGEMVRAQLPVLTNAVEYAKTGLLDGQLAEVLCSSAMATMDRTLAQLAQRASAMKLAFMHGDLWAHHVGRCPDTGRLIACDLGFSGRGPRFFDIAPFVVPDEDLPPLCLSSQEIAERYLVAHEKRTGEKVVLAEFMSEVRDVSLAWGVRCLSWWLPPSIAMESTAERERCRQSLLALLRRLID